MSAARLLTAATLARTADAGSAVVVVLASLREFGGPAQGSLALAALLVPHVVAGPFVGVFTDRARRPRLVHTAFVAGFGVALGGVLLLLGRAPQPVVLALALVAGCCGPMIFGGLSSRLDDVVVPRRRQRFRGLDAATYNVAEITGPAVGALLVVSFGVPAAALALTGSCLAAAALLLTIPGRPARPRPATEARPTDATADEAAPVEGVPVGAGRFVDDLRAGLRAIVVSRPLRAVTAATCVAGFGLGMMAPVAVLLGAAHGHGSGGGLLVTALGAGALAGSLLVARRPVDVPPHLLALGCLSVTGVALAVVPFVDAWPVLVAVFAVAGFCDGPLLASVLQVRSTEAPPHTRMQVFTLGAGLKITAAALGAAAFTVVAGWPVAALASALAATQLAAAAVGGLLLLRFPS